VEYEIDVYSNERTGIRDASGKIRGDDRLLFDAWNLPPNMAVQLFVDAGPMSINVIAYKLGSGQADIVVSGPVPGL
jgi:hypothetical protein